jgi:homoserine acetyltransferase
MTNIVNIKRADCGAIEGTLALPRPFGLYHGGELADPQLAWRLAGDESLPVVVAIGGISAHRRVFDAQQIKAGWWHEVVGPGRALDSSRCRVLGIDYLAAVANPRSPRARTLFVQLRSGRSAASAADHLALQDGCH